MNKILTIQKNQWSKPMKALFYLVLATTCLSFIQPVKAEVLVGNNRVSDRESVIKAGHFLSQATMGGTVDEIDTLAGRIRKIGEDRALREWLNTQTSIAHESFTDHFYNTIDGDGFTIDTKYFESDILARDVSHYLQITWWDRAIQAPDQLRHRVAWALMQTMVTSKDMGGGNLRPAMLAGYYDVLLRNALGSYENLLKEVTYSPAMGYYLGSMKSGKGDDALGTFADENFAREVLQLFSMGVYQLDQKGNYILDSDGLPLENYTNDEVKEFAKVFTGLTHADENNVVIDTFHAAGGNNVDVMAMHSRFHDETQKTLLRNEVLPAGQSGDQDIEDALANIINTPSVAPFIVRRLIQRLTTSNPSEDYIGRITDVWTTSNGSLKEVAHAILLDSEARDSLNINQTAVGNRYTRLDVTAADPLHGKIKEPVLMATHIYRFFEAESQEHDNVIKMHTRYADVTEQAVFESPSVFNHYSPYFAPSSGPIAAVAPGLVLPELELLPRSLIPMFEGVHEIVKSEVIEQNIINGMLPSKLPKLTSYKEEAAQNGDDWLVDELDLYMLQGTMSAAVKEGIISGLKTDSLMSQEDRISNLIAIILSSPEFAVVH